MASLDGAWRPVSTRTVECDALACGYGFVPQLDLPVQLDCAVRRDLDGSPVVAVDEGMRTSVPGVYAAGESTGVGGAVLAEVEGRVAGRSAAADLGRPAPPDPALSRRRNRLAAFARALHGGLPGTARLAGLAPRRHARVPLRGGAPVGRREAQAMGAADARSVKLLARPGMGWCQGRMCGYAVACLAA